MTDRRLTGVHRLTGRILLHRFAVYAPSDLDDDFAGRLREAIEVGNGRHRAR